MSLMKYKDKESLMGKMQGIKGRSLWKSMIFDDVIKFLNTIRDSTDRSTNDWLGYIEDWVTTFGLRTAEGAKENKNGLNMVIELLEEEKKRKDDIAEDITKLGLFLYNDKTLSNDDPVFEKWLKDFDTHDEVKLLESIKLAYKHYNKENK